MNKYVFRDSDITGFEEYDISGEEYRLWRDKGTVLLSPILTQRDGSLS